MCIRDRYMGILSRSKRKESTTRIKDKYPLFKTRDVQHFKKKLSSLVSFLGTKKIKSYRHTDFPSGPPPQYQPCLRPLNFGVRLGSGAFDLVWPIAIIQYLMTI
eukprot:TRINITY_DN27001_c0_g1_i5.p2 TRINITY_DN27001_c0_g1~~TRINITY_DN27001_c0_g1_i5.p2  ORF type:complete len:104 (+),score=2.88 TRINITY_DN27001_c0_g1_i5:174-485(+)